MTLDQQCRWNDTEWEYNQEETVHRRIEQQAARTPEQVAILHKERSMTYRELNESANRLAEKLRAGGAARGTLVGVMVERGPDMLVAILSVLKTGAAYVPIDPEYPVERIGYMLEDSGAEFLLTQSGLAEGLAFQGRTLDVGDAENYIGDGGNLNAASEPMDLAYVIYTSGSTGKPKGVMIEHRSVANFVEGMVNAIAFREGKTILALTTVCFDIFLVETLLPLTCGMRVGIGGLEEQRDPRALARLIEAFEVDMLQATPSRMTQLLLREATAGRCLGRLSEILLGGEALPYPLLEKIRGYTTGRIYNMYGPTETTIWSAAQDVTAAEKVDIGKPIANTRMYIVDDSGQMALPGVTGELVIAGDGLARGYKNRPELTAEKFVRHALEPRGLIYRTGDLAKWASDGSIEVLGRADQQVKIRGYRVEVGEVESILARHESISDIAIVAKEETDGYKSLCVFYVSDTELASGELRSYAQRHLPGYMVPSYYFQLDEMPLTLNYKTDRNALLRRLERKEAEVDTARQNTSVSNQLAEIWSTGIGIDTVADNDHFFAVGGDSMKAIKVVYQANQRFSTVLEVADLYHYPVFADFAKRVSDQLSKPREPVPLYEDQRKHVLQWREELLRQSEGAPDAEAEPAIIDIYPLSDIQHGMVLQSLIHPDRFVYHEQYVFYHTDPGGHQLELLQEALGQLVLRHPMLRTSYELNRYPVPMQLVYSAVEIHLTVNDLRHLDVAGQEKVIKAYLEQDKRNPFELTKASKQPLWRLAIFPLSADGSACMCLTFHHSIMDGWSIGLFMKEYLQIYEDLKQGNSASPVHRINSTYQDYIVEQMYVRTNEEHSAFWKRELENYPEMQWFGESSADERAEHNHIYEFPIEERLMQQMALLSDGLQMSIQSVFFAAFSYMIQMHADDKNVVVGLVGHNRPVSSDSDGIIGCFLNTLPVRIAFTPAPVTWQDWICRINDKVAEAKRFGRYPLMKMLEDCKGSRSRLFDTFFNYTDFRSFPSWQTRHTSLRIDHHEQTETGLDFHVVEEPDRTFVRIHYLPSFVAHDEVRVMAAIFRQMLSLWGEHAQAPIDHVQVFLEEHTRPIQLWNDTEWEYDREETVHRRIERQAVRTPEQVAILHKERSMTYRELNEGANRLAEKLRAEGAARGTLVGVMVERGPEMLVAILSVLKTGAAYVPIDPEYPVERIGYMLEDSGAEFLLTQSGLAEGLAFQGRTLDVGDAENYIGDGGNLNAASEPMDLAYVIYTSGSTGKPKGVMIEHRSVANFVEGMVNAIAFREGKTILALTTVCFDIFLVETLLPLTCGMRVGIGGLEEQRDPRALARLIEAFEVDMLQATPSRMTQLLLREATAGRCLSRLSEILLGGEALPYPLLDKIRGYTTGRIYNMYGPTETTIWSAVQDVTAAEKVDIGKPIANTRMYIVDDSGQMALPGVTGELVIAGDGLARGYKNRPELTAEKFVRHAVEPRGLIYRTGDLAQWSPDGSIEVLGRADQQVKIRGYRVEVGEVESILARHESISDIAIVAKEETDSYKSLCVFYVSDTELASGELRSYAQRHLPGYMIPSYYFQLDEMPQTANGKTNRKELQNRADAQSLKKPPVAARTELERRLTDIWSQLLQRDSIGVNEHFFEVGGNSISVLQLLEQIQQLDNKITGSDIFSYPTIQRMAEFMERSQQSLQYRPVVCCFPQQYAARLHEPGASGFQSSMDAATLRDMERLSDQHHVQPSDLFAGAFAYLLSKVADQSKLEVHYHWGGEEISALRFDMEAETSMSSLFQSARDQRQQAVPVDSEKLLLMRRMRTAKADHDTVPVMPLIAAYGGQAAGATLEEYDLILKIKETPEFQVICEFRPDKLNRDKLKSFLNNYVFLIKKMSAPGGLSE
ncbi:amino acid adenylation domain-containing protein [Paenibacillus oenotherae]|uniref:Amino acid adenylation domain-containing protein n=1 Tax=Paenibacillus oenotherae TaxID=1435645 RepID=A0ABS7D5G5_9BACL|nr:non-ribosomal peptide synthetase [Paenibacillus oenotherae]MBW7475089.1 amino acid adenylation domain-containing protein [Paenibacillus oenotherae]